MAVRGGSERGLGQVDEEKLEETRGVSNVRSGKESDERGAV